MKVGIFPVGITPTKPLTPTHIKGILILDTMRKLIGLRNNVKVLYNQRVWNASQQTLRFRSYLQAHHCRQDFEQASDLDIGRLYVDCANAGYVGGRHLQDRVLTNGFLHPSAKRMLAIWRAQCQRIGVDLDFLSDSGELGYQLNQMYARLSALDLILDYSDLGGSTYLDLSHRGVPIRQLKSGDGGHNYLALMIAELLNQVEKFDRIILPYDRNSSEDFTLLVKLFDALGATFTAAPFARLNTDGKELSSRQGGWEHVVFDRIIPPILDKFDRASVQVGLRSYFLHTAGHKNGTNFDCAHLERDVDHWRNLDGVMASSGDGTQGICADKYLRNGYNPDIYALMAHLKRRRMSQTDKMNFIKIMVPNFGVS